MGKRNPTDAEVVRYFGISVNGEFERRQQQHVELASKPQPGNKHPTSPRAARELCQRAADCLEWGWEMDEAMREYIITVLRHVANGGSADAAFGTNRKPKLDALDQYERDTWLVLQVDALRQQGMSKREALERVSLDGLGTYDTTNLKRIYRQHRPDGKPKPLIKKGD